MKFPLPFLGCVVLLAGGLRAAENPYGLPDGLYTEITTPRGVVVCELFYKKTPMTVANHVGLAEGTLGPAPRKPYYDGTPFHRVVADFVVQGGQGGRVGYSFPDEIVPGLRHDGPGILQMANAGPDTNGSQFCLMLSQQHRLNYNHTVFGRVVRGGDVPPKVQQGDAMTVKILRLGDDAKAFKADEETFKALVEKAKKYAGPKAPGPDAYFDDPDRLLPTSQTWARGFNSKLANVERFIGRKLYARVFAKSPEGDTADESLISLAKKLDIAREGVLAAYYADRDEWHFYIAGSAATALLGQAPEEGKTVKQYEVAFLVTSATQPAPSTRPVPPGQKIKLSVDAVLDNLIFKLEPKAE